MEIKHTAKSGKFGLGQVVQHDRYNYRGVIYDVDPEFMLPDEWYEQVAKAKPPKDEPWYKVLVDGTDQEAYVAEQHLQIVLDAEPVQHEALEAIFEGFENGRYRPRLRPN